MMQSINRTKWKKIKKNYQRVIQNFSFDEVNGSVLVTQHYRKRLNLGDASNGVCDSLTPIERLGG
jgi:hypothetical protein